MKKRNKVLLTGVSAAALVTVSVLGTIAYLTSTDTVTNTFSVGKVGISLVETQVDENGVPVEDDEGNPLKTTEGNNYRIVPGMSYTKDPTMTVEAGSDDAYLRMLMTVSDHKDVQAIIDNEAHGLTDYADLLTGWNETEWLYEGFEVDEDADTITFEFRYKETVDGFGDTADAETGELPEEAVTLSPLFTGLKIPGTLTSDEVASLDKFEMTLVGHAIQATGFADADAAWVAFDGQVE